MQSLERYCDVFLKACFYYHKEINFFMLKLVKGKSSLKYDLRSLYIL